MSPPGWRFHLPDKRLLISYAIGFSGRSLLTAQTPENQNAEIQLSKQFSFCFWIM